MNPPKKVTLTEIARTFGFSVGRAKQLQKEGMPLDSIESATAWRNARLLRSRQGGAAGTVRPSMPDIDTSSVEADESFDETVDRHRQLKEAARLRYIAAADAGLSDQKKLYEIYQHITKTLVTLEREALARRISARQLVESSLVLERLWKVMLEIKADVQNFGLSVATKANPENPQIALAACNEKADALLEKWSKAHTAVEEEIAEAEVKDAAPPDLTEMGGETEEDEAE